MAEHQSTDAIVLEHAERNAALRVAREANALVMKLLDENARLRLLLGMNPEGHNG